MIYSENVTNSINARALLNMVEGYRLMIINAPDNEKKEMLLDLFKVAEKVANAQLKSTSTIESLLAVGDNNEFKIDVLLRDRKKILLDKEKSEKKFEELKKEI